MTDKTLRLKSFTDLHHFDWLTCSACRQLVWWDTKDRKPMPQQCPNCNNMLLPLTTTENK